MTVVHLRRAVGAALLLLLPINGFLVGVPTTPSTSTSRTGLDYSQEDESTPSSIESPVLKGVYPKLIEYKALHGHPNIPLGSTEGRQCETLRRLHIQRKLTEAEEELLKEMGFRFHSLEDVYHTVDFDELFARLEQYELEHQTQYQVPKKFAPDPELGAWVTGIRRLGPQKLEEDHSERLNKIGFPWKSNRKCGSKFMQQYRQYKERAEQEAIETMIADNEVRIWLEAQKKTKERGSLSETRNHYLEQLFGDDWTDKC